MNEESRGFGLAPLRSEGAVIPKDDPRYPRTVILRSDRLHMRAAIERAGYSVIVVSVHDDMAKEQE